MPLLQQGESPMGFLVAGLNRYRPVDEGYRGFLSLVAARIAADIGLARSYRAEQLRAEQLAELVALRDQVSRADGAGRLAVRGVEEDPGRGVLQRALGQRQGLEGEGLLRLLPRPRRRPGSRRPSRRPWGPRPARRPSASAWRWASPAWGGAPPSRSGPRWSATAPARGAVPS